MPSAVPSLPAVPASVLTAPAGVILRMVKLIWSATYTAPAASTATPMGTLKRAAAPVPSALPPLPAVPASVVTTPAGVILRMVELFVSATYTAPAASTATPNGLLKRAPAPVPSALPLLAAVPASVLTTPAGVILRMVELFVSATYTVPAASTATPLG